MAPILIAFLSLATTGIFDTILGTALPSIQVFLRMDTAQAGLFASFAWLGVTAAISVGGILSDCFEQNLILMVACITVGLSSVFFGFSSLFGLNCLLISFLGAGTGVISRSSSTLVIKFYPRKEGLMINIQHFFYGLGAITGPLCMGCALKQGWHWQSVYRAGRIWMLLLAGIFAFPKKELQIHYKLTIDKSFFSLIREKKPAPIGLGHPVGVWHL
jgi:MFS family permease